MDANTGYVVAGYTLTAAALGAYVWRLLARARVARRRIRSAVGRQDN